MKALIEGGEEVEALRERILGRVSRQRRAASRDRSGGAGGRCAAQRRAGRRHRGAGHRRGEGAHAAHLRDALRAVREVLRPRPRARPAGERGRGDRRDRRAVHRRAGHAAHHAHLPHRRCGFADRGGEPAREQVHGNGALLARRCATSPIRAGEPVAISRSGEVADRRRQRPRARAPQGAVRGHPGGDGRRAGEGREGAGELGPAHPADHHRVRRTHQVRERRGRRDGGQADRRGHRLVHPGGDRSQAPRRGAGQGPAAQRQADRRQGQGGEDPGHGAAGQHHLPDPLDHHGEGRPAGAGGRSARAHSAGDLQDPRHHRAVCRGWRSCSRRARPRTRACWRRSPARCPSARTPRASSAW